MGPANRLTVPRYAPAPADAAEEALRQFERQQSGRRSRIDMMRQYAEARSCRGRTLLAYFGEQVDRDCGHCDTCASPSEPMTDGTLAEDHGDRPFPVNSAVRHIEWGTGTVMSYERDRMVVLFTDVGYRTLSISIVQRGGLLVAV